MNAMLAEFIGTAIILTFGGGVVANVILQRTKGGNSGWIVIAWGWAIGVFVGVFCSQEASGAHLNPAISLSLALAGKFPWASVPGYVGAQLAGAFVGAILVGLFYGDQFLATDDVEAKLGVFCTAPAIRNVPRALFCETVATFCLAFPVFLISAGTISLPGLDGAARAVPIGLSLGGTTGYAINPARDLAPRIVHSLLPLGKKRDSDWSYAWVPVVGPLLGGALAALLAVTVL